MLNSCFLEATAVSLVAGLDGSASMWEQLTALSLTPLFMSPHVEGLGRASPYELSDL